MASEALSAADLFECKKCGDCCNGYGGTFVSQEDILRIAEFIREDPERFIEKYCRMSGRRHVLAQAESGYCVFWDGLCRIHPVKPWMCRIWPFIPSVLIDIDNWRIMATCCPGMRTDISDEFLESSLRSLLRSRDRRL